MVKQTELRRMGREERGKITFLAHYLLILVMRTISRKWKHWSLAQSCSPINHRSPPRPTVATGQNWKCQSARAGQLIERKSWNLASQLTFNAWLPLALTPAFQLPSSGPIMPVHDPDWPGLCPEEVTGGIGARRAARRPCGLEGWRHGSRPYPPVT